MKIENELYSTDKSLSTHNRVSEVHITVSGAADR